VASLRPRRIKADKLPQTDSAHNVVIGTVYAPLDRRRPLDPYARLLRRCLAKAA
jgi:hypothetical protein